MPSSLLSKLINKMQEERGSPRPPAQPSQRMAKVGTATLIQRQPTTTHTGPAPTLSVAVRARSFVPRAYQIEGIEFLREHKRAILGDAPGLGKTFQATEAAELPCVITCPLPLVDQWADFLADQYPNDPVSIAAYGDILERDAGLRDFTTRGGWLIVNHDAWRRLYIPPAKTVIADEFHHFRNHEAKRSKQFAAYAAPARTPRVYGLTATPVYKDIGDLWHELFILDQAKWNSRWAFLNTYAVTTDYGFGTKVVKMRNKPLLERETKSYLIQRTYSTVGMALPDRIDKHVVLRLSAADQKRYNMLRDYYRLHMSDDPNSDFKRLFNAGAVLHELRKLTVTPAKLEAIKELVEEAQVATERPVTVFCWYQDTAHKLTEALGATEITGDVDAAKRADLAKAANTVVATIASLSEGVDLSQGRTVVFAECNYTPGSNYQALSRVIRARTDGQSADDPVICYWVRYAATVDQTVFETQRDRTNGSAMDVLKEALGME